MLFWKSDFEKKVDAAIAGDTAAQLVLLFTGLKVTTSREAKAIVRRLAAARNLPSQVRTRNLKVLLDLCEHPGSQESFDVLKQRGTPLMVEIYDGLRLEDPPDASILLSILGLLAGYRCKEGAPRILEAIATGLGAGESQWQHILGALDPRCDDFAALYSNPCRSIPDARIQLELLKAANELCREKTLHRHPFDNPEGLAQLRSWLVDADDQPGAFHAAGAIGLLRSAGRAHLLDLALSHRATDVRRESAWSAAKLGLEPGIAFLVAEAGQVHTASAALEYLRELRLEHRAPKSSLRPEFRDMAEFSRWLQFPTELGHAPAELSVYDTREIYWPPTDDRRRVSLVRFIDHPESPGKLPDRGVGMVGSITFCLFGTAAFDMAPEDVYALHCSWELRKKDDARAPEKLDLESASKLWRRISRA